MQASSVAVSLPVPRVRLEVSRWAPTQQSLGAEVADAQADLATDDLNRPESQPRKTQQVTKQRIPERFVDAGIDSDLDSSWDDGGRNTWLADGE